MLCMQIPASTTRENPVTRHPPSDPTHPPPRLTTLSCSPTCTLSLPLLHRHRFPGEVKALSLVAIKTFLFSPGVPSSSSCHVPSFLRRIHRNKEREKRIAQETGKALIERRQGRPSKISSAYVANFLDLIIGEGGDTSSLCQLTDRRYIS